MRTMSFICRKTSPGETDGDGNVIKLNSPNSTPQPYKADRRSAASRSSPQDVTTLSAICPAWRVKLNAESD